MKRFYVLPLIILAIGAVWSTFRARQIHKLEEKVRALEAQFRTGGERTFLPGGASYFRDLEGNPKKGDWERIGRDLVSLSSIMRWSTPSLGDQLALLSEQELIDALDEVASASLPSDLQILLKRKLLYTLALKFPERAIATCDLSDPVEKYFVTLALHAWLRSDPGKALAWYEGTGKSQALDSDSMSADSDIHAGLERAVIGHLLKTDPASALDLIDQLPREEIQQLASNMGFIRLDATTQKELMTQFRSKLTEQECAEILNRWASEIPLTTKSDYPKSYRSLDDLFNSIEATPQERHESFKRLSNHIARNGNRPLDALEPLREWTAHQTPGSEEPATGEFLRDLYAYNRITFDEALQRVTSYHHRSGSDELIHIFLEGVNSRLEPEQLLQAQKLANEIRDERLRDSILRQLNQ